MALSDIIKQKSERLETVPAAFQNRVGKSQKEIFEELLVLLQELETKEGLIVVSEANLLLVDQIITRLETVVNQSEYVEAVREFAKEFDTQGEITRDFFTKALETTDFNSLQGAVLKAQKKNAVELLLGGSIDADFYNPVRSLINDSVTSGNSLKSTIKGIRTIVEGDAERLGALESYSGQIAYDSFAIADAAYTNAIATEIEAEWYRYVGGLVKDSRPFCTVRNNNYYHRKEVEAWATETWAGKFKNTDATTIFLFRGGYRCQHSLIPVSISAVPPDVIKRNVLNGNYEEKKAKKK